MFYKHRCFSSVLLATYPALPSDVLWQLSATLFAITSRLATKSETDAESNLNKWRTTPGNIPATKTSIHYSYVRCICTENFHLVEVNETVCTTCTLTHDSQQCVGICVCVMLARTHNNVLPLFDLFRHNTGSVCLKWGEMNTQTWTYLDKRQRFLSESCTSFL